jgi:hypothetical protein
MKEDAENVEPPVSSDSDPYAGFVSDNANRWYDRTSATLYSANTANTNSGYMY